MRVAVVCAVAVRFWSRFFVAGIVVLGVIVAGLGRRGAGAGAGGTVSPLALGMMVMGVMMVVAAAATVLVIMVMMMIVMFVVPHDRRTPLGLSLPRQCALRMLPRSTGKRVLFNAPLRSYIQTMSSAGHDHAACIHNALARAETLCAERGARLTALRKRVLELVWAGHRPRGAYQILDDLRAAEGKCVAPLTVYRALEFLEDQGLVHRIECLNAYVGCPEPKDSHRGQFLVCTTCGVTVEIDDPDIRTTIETAAAAHGFVVDHPVVEVRGLCRTCRQEQTSE